MGYFQASEGDVREALASVISMKLTFPTSVSPPCVLMSVPQGGGGGGGTPALYREGGGDGGTPALYKEGGGEMMGVPQPCTGRGGGGTDIVCSIHVHVHVNHVELKHACTMYVCTFTFTCTMSLQKLN